MSLLSHRASRGLANQLLVPLALMAVLVLSVVGGVLTLDTRDAAKDGLMAQARAIDATAVPLIAPAHGKRPRGWGSTLARVAAAHQARVTVELGRATRTYGAAQVPSAAKYRFPLEAGRGSIEVELPGHVVATATVRAALAALLGGVAGIVLLVVLGSHLVKRRVTVPLAALGASLEGLRDGRRMEPSEEAELASIRELADVARTGSHLASTFDELSQQAATDPLTGVGNRRFFDSALDVEIKRAQRAQGAMSLVLLDLDGFKELNDTYGHRLGDETLRTVAEKLRDTLRGTDVIARVGGDEFALILPEMTRDQALAVVERAREEAEHNFEGHALSWSAGVACFPTDAVEPGVLMECADAALYSAKAAGTGRTARYDASEPGVRRPGGEVAEVEAVLSEPDAVVAVFQPLVSLTNGQISGYEALTRFPKPPVRRPDEWFNLAHRVGLGAALEARALREALSAPGRPPGVYLSFNVSPSALSSDEVMAVLPRSMTGLVVEITEHENVADEAALLDRLEEMRRRGARIAIDDAGAGYSGLQQVMRLQPDIIKLDRSLVGNVDSDAAKAALIDSFVRFARRTDATIVAEGIETAEELKVLADLEVDYGQGFGLASPGPPWAPIASWVAGTLHHRMMRSADAAAGDDETRENDDMRLAHLTGRIAAMACADELPAVSDDIASEVGADEVCVMRTVGDKLETLTPHSWMPLGKQLSMGHHATMANVVTSRAVVQVTAKDGGAGLGELALMAQVGYATMLIAPVFVAGETVGLMLAFSSRERPWSRVETSRARVIAHQLGPVIGARSSAAAPAVPEPLGLDLAATE
ncbi:MAG: EAL domain-containing protein [Thermoleophilaceae bacterium]